MTEAHFSQQVTRLQETYGRPAFNTERTKLIWRDVQALDPAWLTETVDKFIGTFRQAPLVQDFAEQAAMERERIYKIEKDMHTVRGAVSYSCDFCRDNGAYLCVLRGDRTKPYAFRCHCSRGESDPRKNIPQYKQEHKDQGFVYYEIDWDKEISA